MSVRLVASVALVACGARLQGGPPAPDVVVDAPAIIDGAPAIDARPCTGGDANGSNGTSCFVFVKTLVDHDGAEAACAAMNAHLAKVDDAATNTMLAQMVLGFDTFIGANDIAVEGTFVYDDGTPVTYTNWRTGEPSNGGGHYQEDCVVIEGKKTPDDTWDDRPCAPVPNVGGGMYSYLCQY
jgi:hypothetical protein